jgi:hypothetical protein
MRILQLFVLANFYSETNFIRLGTPYVPLTHESLHLLMCSLFLKQFVDPRCNYVVLCIFGLDSW